MLARYYDKALDGAALILALARCKITDREPSHRLRRRQSDQLLQLIHDFCYNARKTIELADSASPGIIRHAQSISLHGFGETELTLDLDGKKVPLAQKTLWWLLGRVIHSQEAEVQHHGDVAVGTEWATAPRITEYETPVAFGVRSDQDATGTIHYVRTERLVEAFLALTTGIEEAITLYRGPMAH